jgi:hypothetical protein
VNNNNNIAARMSYDYVRETLFRAWIKSFNNDVDATWKYIDGMKLSQSENRFEVGLSTTSTTFQFGVTLNDQNSDGVVFKTERRLKQQDTLIVNEYAIFTAQTTGAQDDNNYKLNTWADPLVFTGNAGADRTALENAFYANGSFGITVNNDIVMPYRGLFNHLYVPETQQTAAIGANSPISEIRGCEDGFITAEPNIYIIGSKGYVPIISLTKALASVTTGERAILVCRGILAQNSTVIN